MRGRLFRPGLGALAVVGALLLAGGVAYATIPDSNGVIHGCYATKDGSLRVVDPSNGGTCDTKKEQPLDWSQTGPQGPAGPQGPPGPAGMSGLERATSTISIPSGFFTTKDLPCPAGKTPISGGWNAQTLAPGFEVDESHASGSDWIFTFYNGTGSAVSVDLDTLCADVQS